MKKDPECQDRQFTQLMNQVRELKEENVQLRNRLNEKDTQDKENTVWNYFVNSKMWIVRNLSETALSD